MKKLNLAKSQSGFTLIELLVVIGILAILLAITLIAINPNKHFQDTRNAKRSSDVAAILDSIYEYQSANSGTLPVSVQGAIATPTLIGTGSGEINLCDVVPTYLADIPLDPNGTKSGATACAGGADTYESHYQIVKTGVRFTVSAPDAEGGASISVTR
ncbi:MAG: type II secretion system protein [Candidatus Saccharimonadales bacterium]